MMTQGFYEFFKENFEDGLSSPSKYILKFTFEAGAQSRQAEIDGLKKAIDEAMRLLQTRHHNADVTNIIMHMHKILKGNQND